MHKHPRQPTEFENCMYSDRCFRGSNDVATTCALLFDVNRWRTRKAVWLESSTKAFDESLSETNRVSEERKSVGLVITRYSALCPRDPDLFFRIRYCDYYYMITFKRNKKKNTTKITKNTLYYCLLYDSDDDYL